MAHVAPANDEGPEVLYGVADHIATITLNRPERMNTISRAMLSQLTERLLEAADRGLWAEPDKQTVADLRAAYLEVEGQLEEGPA